MVKKIHLADNLWKIKAFRDLISFEEKGWKVTRDLIRDHERSIDLIKHGFDEGIKYTEEIRKKEQN